MTLIADILLAAGAIGAAFYCLVLGRRLKRFNDLEKGMGGAVAVLSAQVDDLEKTLNVAQQAAKISTEKVEAVTQRAEDVRRQLEIQMAALHDVVPQSTTANSNAIEPSTQVVPESTQQNAEEGASEPVDSTINPTQNVEADETIFKAKDEENPGPIFMRRRASGVAA